MWQGRSRQDKSGRGERADAQAAIGTRARFEATVMPHLDAAYNLARWLSGSASDADDVVQEAYLRAFRFFSGFEGGEEANEKVGAIVRERFGDLRRLLVPAEDE